MGHARSPAASERVEAKNWKRREGPRRATNTSVRITSVMHMLPASSSAARTPIAPASRRRRQSKSCRVLYFEIPTGRVLLFVRKWRNWQTRKPQELVAARSWRFKSSLPHQPSLAITRRLSTGALAKVGCLYRSRAPAGESIDSSSSRLTVFARPCSGRTSREPGGLRRGSAASTCRGCPRPCRSCASRPH
jgi:hypothetical protein